MLQRAKITPKVGSIARAYRALPYLPINIFGACLIVRSSTAYKLVTVERGPHSAPVAADGLTVGHAIRGHLADGQLRPAFAIRAMRPGSLIAVRT